MAAAAAAAAAAVQLHRAGAPAGRPRDVIASPGSHWSLMTSLKARAQPKADGDGWRRRSNAVLPPLSLSLSLSGRPLAPAHAASGDWFVSS